jgi:transcription-repair coupling factor (superfamily II helicase)
MSPPFILSPADPLPGQSGQCLRLDGVRGAAVPLAISDALQAWRGICLIVTDSEERAESLETQLRFFLPAEPAIALLPDPEVLPYDHFSPHEDLISARMRLLRELELGQVRVLITAAPNLLPRLPPRQFLASAALQVATGDEISLERFQQRLDRAGYQRAGQVTGRGEYAIRGSLLDFFAMGCEAPARVDFLDDVVDSIRLFDPDTQLSSSAIDSIDSLPAREFPSDAEAVKYFRQRFRRRFEGNPTQSQIYREISEGRFPPGVESYLPLFFDEMAALWDYLPAELLIITTGETAVALTAAWQQVTERHGQLEGDLERPLLRPDEVFAPPELILEFLAKHRLLELHGILPTSPDQTGAEPISRAVVGPLVNPREAEPGARLVSYVREKPGRFLMAVESAGRREMLHELLLRAGESVTAVDSWPEFLASPARLVLTHAALEDGAEIPGASISIISERELFGQLPRQTRRRRRVRDPESIIGDLTDLRLGAPVVHADHGVGRYVGLTRLEIGGAAGEFVTLEYEGGDRLHVPVGSLHLVSRYTGASPEQAPLHRLGTDQWQKARRRAAERIRDVAAELLDLYSRRASRPGRSAQFDTSSYEAFAAGFPFALTEDQARAIDEVLADLADQKPMDRVVCGDVGFGKTEVALRATFAVVNSGRQVAVLVPTTLLAQQHYETFADRFADWPVHIEVLSRFRSAAEHRGILERAGDGKVDIVIGTHRLLQKDVKFRNLGLVIVDEEQRFGVNHKEKLKSLRTEVDILTLTATPIPRTLNLALGGLRELSLITTPPESRLAIRTFLTTWTPQIIREACLRELKRGGQVYFVHNRIEDIARVAEEVARIVPEASVEVAHGQMHERDLERVMLDFYNRRFQVLVCTAIIESGLDVPSANTIIIDQADRFGLAQLHQLRGRVGRSHHQAFAYLIAPPQQALNPDALKRLEALESLQDLGSGFVLATHDLEIRGAGELLGEEQSGQIQEIGFNLYNEMLARTVRALQSGKAADLNDTGNGATEIDLHVPAMLPEELMPDVHARLVLYKRIASAPTQEAVNDLELELIDRLGPLQPATRNLLRITSIRLQARRAGIRRLSASITGGHVEFAEGGQVDPVRLVRLIESDPREFRLDPRQRLMFRRDLEKPDIRMRYCEQLIERLAPEEKASKAASRPSSMAS